jgi:hypothetical protein
VNGGGRPVARGFGIGLVATAILAFGVPAVWYAVCSVFSTPNHDDMVSLMLSSEGKWRAGPVLEPPQTEARSVREILAIVEPRPDYGAARTAIDAYRLSINPPVYLALLNLWRRTFGGSAGAALILSVLLCGLSACAFYGIAARRSGGPAALLFSAIYCFSPTYWEAALFIRNYALSALVSVLLAGALVWLVRAAPPATGRAAALFVACGAFLMLVAYQAAPLVMSLVAGLLAVAALRRDPRFARTSILATVALLVACAPILFMARWQGMHGGARGVVVNTLRPFGDTIETLRAALQALLSLFVDLPYAHLPLAALVAAIILILGALVFMARGESRAPAAGTLLAVALPVGCALYAIFVLLKVFPAWFALRYFAAYAAAYLTLLAHAPMPDAHRAGLQRLVLGALLFVSAGSFVARAGQYALTQRPQDQVATEALGRTRVIVTDALHDAQVLRIAAHASPDARVWLLRLPLDADTCRAIADDARTPPIALVRVGEVDGAALDAALRTCLPDARPQTAYRRGWLDLTIIDPGR